MAPPRRRRSSSPLEREPLNFLPSGSGWFGAAQISERNVALGCPRLLLPTSGKDDDTEPVGGTAPQSLWTMLQRQLIPPPLIGFLSCSAQRSLGSGPNEPPGREAPHGWVDVSPRGLQDVGERKRRASLSPIVADVAALPGEEGQVPAAQPGVTAQRAALSRLAAQPPQRREERAVPKPRQWHASQPQPNLGSPRQQPPAPAQFQSLQTGPILGSSGEKVTLRCGHNSSQGIRECVCVCSVRWVGPTESLLLPILAIYGRGERRLEAAHLTSECPGMGCCHPWVVLATTVDISSDLT